MMVTSKVSFSGVMVHHTQFHYFDPRFHKVVRLKSDLGLQEKYPIDSVRLTGQQAMRASYLQSRRDGYLGYYSKTLRHLVKSVKESPEYKKLAKAWAKWEKSDVDFKLYVYQRTLTACRQRFKTMAFSEPEYDNWPKVISRLETLVREAKARNNVLTRQPVKAYEAFQA